jgi:phosphoglycolate phosphatase-like HAD superfamily hydrolase
LEQLGLHAHLRLVLGCDSVASPKPAPDMAEIFMAHVGVPKHRLVMVGDAPADLECARRAGCRSVAAAWGFSAVDVLLQESPDHLAETPARLLEWLRALDLKEDCRS